MQRLSAPEMLYPRSEFILSFENPGNHSLYFNKTECDVKECCVINYQIRNMETGKLVPNDLFVEDEKICTNC